MLMEIRDDSIWAKHLNAAPDLYHAIMALKDGETIRLKVDGIIGKWEKMRTGKDGRPTTGIKPIGAMATVWKRMQSRRGESIDVTWPDDEGDAWLRMADETFEEWYSAEDEEAFGDLRPL